MKVVKLYLAFNRLCWPELFQRIWRDVRRLVLLANLTASRAPSTWTYEVSMKSLLLLLVMFVAPVVWAESVDVLSADELRARVAEVTDAQNKVMLQGSTVTDVDALFSLYTDDFVYIHEAYGGAYTRERLYGNTVRLLERGLYDKAEPRYVIVSTIPGYNAIAVERQETHKGVTSKHLAVFEFRGDKVSKIVEYWK
jgi:hypothetical protein